MALLKARKEKLIKDESPPEEESDSDQNDSGSGEEMGNAGWADSLAKVLKQTKPKNKKTLVLSRAKKHNPDKVKENKKSYDFEIDGEEIKEEKPNTADLEVPEITQKKNQKLALRVKPSWQEIERERTLRKIATRGVVQLFNAVRMQQKELKQDLVDAGPLDHRKDAVMNNINKRKFLDVLMGGKRAKSELVDNSIKYELKKDNSSDDEEVDAFTNRKKKSEWNVLRPDFMTNKKIKHWDEDDGSDNHAKSDTADNTSEDDNADDE